MPFAAPLAGRGWRCHNTTTRPASGAAKLLIIQAPSLEAIQNCAAAPNWLGWAAFLASSWTWCIGMFLPFLLVRDFGIWGWIVFAIPNVLGAAAMGWIVTSPQASAAIVASHRQACMLFSGVTIAFQLFFVESVIPSLIRVPKSWGPHVNEDIALGGVLVIGSLMYLLMFRRIGAGRVAAILVMVISLSAMMLTFGEMHLIYSGASKYMPTILQPFSVKLLWLTPVCVFGFVMCPYLDLTFHRARQRSSNAKASFGVGFGVLFLAMIVFTLVYTPALIANWITPLLGAILAIHMGVQCAFTMAAHAREIEHGGALAGIVAGVLTIAAWIVILFFPRGMALIGQGPGELVYRIFMGFYGLIFPAYVWLVMLPQRSSPSVPTKRNVIIFLAAVLASMPMFWLGFVMSRMIWLVPGLLIVLLARFAVKHPNAHGDAVGFTAHQQNSAPI
jgi:hypothetical protein